ncbi:MAG: PKD domain-containing protein [Muribaculaceae bacterium]
MKHIKFLFIAILAIVASACVESEPDYKNFPSKDVDFSFAVDGSEYTTDFYYVSTIQFTNTSSKQGSVSWNFGDGTTSNEANPTHKYGKSGKYNVTLTVDGAGSRTYPILIMDIVPMLSITEQSDEVVTIKDVKIKLGLELPNPDNLICRYVWRMPEGTTLDDGTPIDTYEGYSHEDGSIDNPGELRFSNIGSQKIEVQTYFDINGENRRLNDSYINVQVGANVEAPTLYYACYGGNIKAYKLIDPALLPEGTKNLPFDMGVSSGVTPQCILYANVEDADYIYILDCGKNFCYQVDNDGVLGDGKITVMSADGTYANVVISNVGGHAFSDPFSGCVVGDKLYYNDRNTGFSTIALTERGKKETRINSNTDSYFCSNQSLGYYGRGIAYGAVHTGLAYDKDGVYWWPKCYNATGIYRFKTDDIGKTDAAPTEILLNGATCKAFALDEKRSHFYCWLTSGAVGVGFAQYPKVGYTEKLSVNDYTKYIKMSAAATAGTAASYEALYVTQFAVDENTGNVYFGFIPDTGETHTTGIYYYDYAAGEIKHFYDSSDKALGICINPKLSKLF